MHSVQIYLPRQPDAAGHYEAIKRELTDRFGGVTAFTRAPAEGLWKPDGGNASSDDIVIFEVLVDDLDAEWWRRYRQDLERMFDQDKVLIHATLVEVL